MSAEITPDDEVRTLSLVPLFKHLDQDEIRGLAELIEQVQFKEGETIFHEHDKGDALYVIDQGRVRIWVRDEDVREVTLSELGPGELFGEMAVLDGGERSASATALADSTLHRLSREDFESFLLKNPHSSLDIIRALTSRLRQTNLLVSQRVTRNVNREMDEMTTLGQRVADKVASFGGSWTFIFLYSGFLIAWMATNTFVLARMGRGEDGSQFDPYPYILLNLMLSMTAALQAPIIMMSQNRSSEKDRLAAENDFKVNLKSETMLEDLVRRDRERGAQLDELLERVQASQPPAAPGGDGRGRDARQV